VVPANGYELNARNTELTFEIRLLGLRWFSAGFHELRGDFVLDPDGRGGRLNVVVRTASIDCRNAFWNERLRSAQWLDTGQYPEMIYRSTHIDFEGTAQATVRGELTLHGVSRPLTLTVTDIDCQFSATDASRSCRFLGHARLRRSDFELLHGFWRGGDAVDIVIRGTK
jgi:polyisoprenoid-binding protein YceI